MPAPLDELPIHQVPLSMAYAATSDRNFYDRCYFNAHDRTGEVFFVTGLGVYPNLGVIDAFATVARGTNQVTLRVSGALGDDRSAQKVGPYRVEVQEPLQRVRLVCDPALGAGPETPSTCEPDADKDKLHPAIAFDLTFDASFPAVDEPHHLVRQGGRVLIDAQRFAQVGTWSGTLCVDGEDMVLSPQRWVGTRDRSWGIRPVGEPEPAGRAGAQPDPEFGFWWTYIPLRFDEFAIVIIAQEDGHGHRSLNEAVRIWPASSARAPEQLGWPRFHVDYRPGSRIPTGASIELAERSGRPLVLEIETLGWVALNCGPGYSGDPEWGHGQWRGQEWLEVTRHDLDDPAIIGRAAFGVIDHVARAQLEGSEGWGLFEHGTLGAHLPSGFTGWESVAG